MSEKRFTVEDDGLVVRYRDNVEDKDLFAVVYSNGNGVALVKNGEIVVQKLNEQQATIEAKNEYQRTLEAKIRRLKDRIKVLEKNE